MKLVIIALLEDDIQLVHTLLREHRVVAFSELPVEGHGTGTPGWYGETPPYRSLMVVAFMPEETASELLDAVGSCAGCKDGLHPLRAWMVDVERSVVTTTSDSDSNERG